MTRSRTAGTGIKVADEVFVATALLHRENPERADFSISEIVARAERENLFGRLRPGVRVHASVHCVANKAPNPGSYRMLYATGTHTRRLLRSGDDVHPKRTGRFWPDADAVPPLYRDLIEQAKREHGEQGAPPARWLDGILKLIGLGRRFRKGEDPDEYVRRLRQNWK